MTTLIGLIKNAKNALIVCHKKPDGDTLGSGLSLYFLIKALGGGADIVCDSPLPEHYAFMPSFDMLNVQSGKPYDICIAVDCAEPERMGKFQDYIRSDKIASVNIDHHKTCQNFARHNFIAPELSSTCEHIFNIIFEKPCAFGGSLTFRGGISVESGALKKIAYCLFVGLSTDTGHFMHSSVTPETLFAAACLASCGIDVHAIARELYRSETKARTRLIQRAIGSMRFYDGDSICVFVITQKDFDETGSDLSSVEGLIDYAINIRPVKAAAGLVESGKNAYKVSFRSKGADVSRIASVFGGGGHTRAAGCMVNGFLEDAVDKIVNAIRGGIN
jgi:phosphoesterase RecJ-like protein